MNDLSQYRAVILCGGQGTRIRGVADNVPKPLVEIGEDDAALLEEIILRRTEVRPVPRI